MTPWATLSTTMPNPEAARTLAQSLVSEGHAACVQIMPIRSVYRWEGAVEEADEALLLCKIRSDLFETVAAFVTKHHDYAVPEIIITPIAGAARPYAAWLEDCLRPRRL